MMEVLPRSLVVHYCPVFGVRFHSIFSSVSVAEWPPIGKELLTRLTLFPLCMLTICNFSYFPFWF